MLPSLLYVELGLKMCSCIHQVRHKMVRSSASKHWEENARTLIPDLRNVPLEKKKIKRQLT